MVDVPGGMAEPGVERDAAALGRPEARIGGIDSVRALAALSVFVCHLAAYWGLQGRLPGKSTQITELGAKGVDLFVVISGFCLALPVARSAATSQLDIRKFFIRRFFRIVPGYYVALAACAALAMTPSTWRYVVAHRASWSDTVLHAVGIQSLVPGRIGTINGSFWSVALEVQLYLLFPLMVLAWRRFGFVSVVVVTAALSLAWSVSRPLHWWVLGDNDVLPARIVQFVVGCWAAHLFVNGRVPSKVRLWVGLVVSGVVATLASTANVSAGNPLLWCVPAACVVLLAAGHYGHRLSRTPLEWLGLVSFSFYLLQQPVLLLTSPAAHRITKSPVPLMLIGMTFALALVIVGSALMYHVIERPGIALGRRVARNGGARERRGSRADAPVG